MNVTDGMAGLRTIDALQLAHGVTSYLPTIITTSDQEATEAVATITERMKDPGSPIAGIHLEGPFLSPEFRGVHRLEYLRTPAGGVPDYVWSDAVRMVTIAPELPGALELIRALRRKGIVVSVGHTGASAEEAERAFEAEATCVTHLFNAMRQFDHRNPNVPGRALTWDGVSLGIIPDGHHVHPIVLSLVDRAARSRVVLVTDATPAAGAPPGAPLVMAGVRLEVAGGRVTGPDGRLAGSALTLDSAIRDWMVHTGAPVEAALVAASERPAAVIGLQGLEIGAPADLVLLDEGLTVDAVMRKGDWVA